MALCFAYYTAYMGTQIATDIHCVGVADLNRSICMKSYILTALTSSFNVLTDFYTLALPIRPVLSLKLRFSQKMGLLCIFMAGLMCVYRFPSPTANELPSNLQIVELA